MRKPKISYEVRCSACGFFELWGLERMVRALVAGGKLSTASEFDAELFAELFRAHTTALNCPECRKTGTLSSRKAERADWEWNDAVRCEDCGAEIPEARLRAVPGAIRCVRCQQEYDECAS